MIVVTFKMTRNYEKCMHLIFLMVGVNDCGMSPCRKIYKKASHTNIGNVSVCLEPNIVGSLK
jgi:hypothetical protein